MRQRLQVQAVQSFKLGFADGVLLVVMPPAQRDRPAVVRFRPHAGSGPAADMRRLDGTITVRSGDAAGVPPHEGEVPGAALRE